MIQRIQTIYLLLATISILFIFIIPIAEITSDNGNIYELKYRGIVAQEIKGEIENTDAYPLAALCTIVFAIAVISIFKFKNRIKQIRLCIFNILLLGGTGFMMWFYLNHFSKALNGTSQFKISIILPLISIILIYLAIRQIKKDEELIRSADRIR